MFAFEVEPTDDLLDRMLRKRRIFHVKVVGATGNPVTVDVQLSSRKGDLFAGNVWLGPNGSMPAIAHIEKTPTGPQLLVGNFA